MRKGDEKRQELLGAAERLFCQQGYEKTSVQDILNAVALSKGGFYHHFASKEEVLTALCARRAERAAAFTAEALNQASTPLGRINALLHGFMPLRRQETDFVAMLLPAIGKPEGRGVAMTYQDALVEHFAPLLKSEIAAAAAVEAVYPPVRDMERVILHLVNHCWMEVAAEIARASREGQGMEQSFLLQTLEKYRRSIELLLDAPFGSIEIIRVEEWDEVSKRIAGV
ncbi:MAG: TetR/AcrR family transcriptional regulator [Aristaeellaceae bacterium]